MIKIAPSILAADPLNIESEVKKVDADPEPTASAKDLFNELFGE